MRQIYLVRLDWRRAFLWPSIHRHRPATPLLLLIGERFEKPISRRNTFQSRGKTSLVIVWFHPLCAAAASVKQEIRTNSRFMKLAQLGRPQTEENENGRKEFNFTKLPTRGKLGAQLRRSCGSPPDENACTSPSIFDYLLHM